jgi:hypothetical protein
MNRGVNGISRNEPRLVFSPVQPEVPFSDNPSSGVKGQLTKGRMSLYSAILYRLSAPVSRATLKRTQVGLIRHQGLLDRP